MQSSIDKRLAKLRAQHVLEVANGHVTRPASEPWHGMVVERGVLVVPAGLERLYGPTRPISTNVRTPAQQLVQERKDARYAAREGRRQRRLVRMRRAARAFMRKWPGKPLEGWLAALEPNRLNGTLRAHDRERLKGTVADPRRDRTQPSR